MAYVEYTNKPKDIFVRSVKEIHSTNGYFTVGHKFLVLGSVHGVGQTLLQDAECLANTWGRTVFATRDQFEIITEV